MEQSFTEAWVIPTSLVQMARHESAVSQIANLLFHITLNKQVINSFPLVKRHPEYSTNMHPSYKQWKH
jgi:hypothetical protein